MDDIGDEIEPRGVKNFQYIGDNVGSNYGPVYSHRYYKDCR